MAEEKDKDDDGGINVPSKEVTERIEKFLDQVRSGKLGVQELTADLKNLTEELYGTSDAYKAAAERVYQHSGSMKDLTTSVRLHSRLLAEEELRISKKLDLINKLIAQTRADIEANKDNASAVEELTIRLKALTDEFDKESRALEEAEDKKRRYNDISKITETTIDALTGVSERWKDTLIGTVLASGSLTKGLTAVVAQMQKQLTLSNAIGSVMMKMQEMTISMAKADDAAAVSLMRYNNASERQIDSTLDMARSNRALGFSQKEVAENSRQLQEVVVSYSGLLPKQQIEMAKLNSTLKTFGVSAQEGAQMNAYLMDTLKMGTEEITKFTHELVDFGKNIGKSFSQLTRELNSSRQVLENYGNSGLAVFKKLTATAKGFGMEVSQITSSMEDQYNSFESAYGAVGRLNSLLAAEGVILDANAMMTMDLADRTTYLSSMLQGTGLAANALSEGPLAKFYLKSVASAQGTSDLGFTLKLLQGNLDDTSEKVDYATRSFEEFMSDDFLKKAKNQQEVFEKFKLAVEQFGIAVMPILRMVTGALTLFNEAMDWLRQNAPLISSGLSGVLTTMLALGIAVKVVTFLSGTLASIKLGLLKITGAETAANTLNTKSVYAKAAAAKAAAAASKASMFTMLGLGGAIALIGVGIGAATLGISQLAEAFKGLNVEQMQGLNTVLITLGVTLAVFAIGMAFLAPKLAVAGAALLPFGAAIALVGAGIGLAAAGMSLLVGQLTKINAETASAIGLVAISIGALTVALALIGKVAIFAGVGMAIAFGGLSLFVASISSESNVKALESLSNILTSLASIDFSNLRENFGNVSESIKSLLDDFDDLDDEKVVKIQKVFGAMQPQAATPAATAPMVTPSVSPQGANTPIQANNNTAAATSAPDLSALMDNLKKLTDELVKLQNVGVTLEMGVSSTKKFAAEVKSVITE